MVKKPFDRIIVFTDGACSGNPGPGGWGSVIVTPEGKVQELGAGFKETTNNRMELSATIQSLKEILKIESNKTAKVSVYTDSTYVIRGITEWIWGWRKRGWKTADGKDVANKSHWQALAEAVESFSNKDAIEWHYVRGHTGVPGNERVDEIAVQFRDTRSPDLYGGPLMSYSVAIHDIPEDTSLPARKESPKKKKAAHSYVSLVDGTPKRHQNWKDCEARVKGRSGAKFKKSTSASDESSILSSWGVDPNDLN